MLHILIAIFIFLVDVSPFFDVLYLVKYTNGAKGNKNPWQIWYLHYSPTQSSFPISQSWHSVAVSFLVMMLPRSSEGSCSCCDLSKEDHLTGELPSVGQQVSCGEEGATEARNGIMNNADLPLPQSTHQKCRTVITIFLVIFVLHTF